MKISTHEGKSFIEKKGTINNTFSKHIDKISK